MLELLGLVFGGVIRLVPEVMKLITQKRDQNHEHRMTLLQLDIDKARAGLAIDQIHAQASATSGIAETQGWIDTILAQSKSTGVAWVDALSSSVRPILTYWHCLILYTAAKVVTLIAAQQSGAGMAEIAGLMITQFDEMLIGSMTSFWFVDRSLRRK